MGKVSNLFSPRYYSTHLENHKEILEQFRPYLNDPKYFSNDFDDVISKWGCEVKTTIGNDYAKDMPWENLKSLILQHGKKLVDSYQPTTTYDLFISMLWANIYNKHDFQEIHNHVNGGAHFSFAYLLESDNSAQSSQFQFVNDDIFCKTIFPVNRFSDPVASTLYRPKQQQGTLLIFPSNLKHHVTQHLSNTRRSTVSGNLTMSFA